MPSQSPPSGSRPAALQPSGLSTLLSDTIYDVAGALSAAIAVPALPYLLWKGLGRGWGQRFGRLPEAMLSLDRPVWLHAASVGETLAAAPLVACLREHGPGIPIVTSSTTLTGQATAQRELAPDAVTLLPLDALRIVDRVFARVRPRCLIIIETELWPGLIRAAQRIGAPVVLVSGTISDRSFRRLGHIRPIVRTALQRISAFGMQTITDAERVIALGAPADRVAVTGSLKASRTPAEIGTPPVAGLSDRPVLIAASTQPGEEAFVFDACSGFWSEHPDLLLLIAPRRPERFDEVAKLIEETGIRFERRSRIEARVSATTRVLLLDTVGELPHLLPMARAVFVGGTVAPIGGHNILEPAACGKPVAFGPNFENVADAAEELCSVGGGWLVQTPDELGRHWWRLLSRPDEAVAMGEKARGVAEARSSAIGRTWGLLGPLLEGFEGCGGHKER